MIIRIFFILLIMSVIVQAQEHVNVEKVGQINLSWDDASDVFVQGDYAFVATGRTGLQIVDISDPEQLELVGSFNENFEDVSGIFVSGDYAYLTVEERGLVVLDISEPSSPEEVGACETSRIAHKITVVDNYAYLTARGLLIIDVSNPANPREVSFYETRYASDVFVRDNYAYIAASGDGLFIIDISNPEEPEWVSSHDTPGYSYGVCVEGDYAYIADGSNTGLRAIDISNPEEPFVTGAIDSLYGEDVFVLDNFAYVVRRHNLLYIVDITDPENLDVVGVCESGKGENKAVFVTGNSAYVAGQHGSNTLFGSLQVFDVSDQENPVKVGAYGYDSIRSIFVDGDFTFAACGLSGLLVLDSSDPENYEIVSELNLESSVNSVLVEGAYAYVSCGSYEDYNDYDGSLHIIDVSDPENPESVGNYDTGTPANNVHIVDDLAYIACEVSRESGELHIIDISDPVNPDSIGGLELEWIYAGEGGGITDVFVEDDLAYLTLYDAHKEDCCGWFLVLDVTDPTEPDSLDCYHFGWNYDSCPSDITVIDEIAYIADQYGGVVIFDVSDPQNIEELGRWDLEDYLRSCSAKAIKVLGDYAYLACSYGSNEGLYVLNVSNPENPFEVGRYMTPFSVTDVFLSGELTYLATDCYVQAYRFVGGGYFAVSSEELDFDYVTVERSEELILTITNVGNEELAVAEISIQNNSFTTDFRGDVVLEPEESYDLTVIFTPQERGEIETTLTITTDDPDDSAVIVDLTGRGYGGIHYETPGESRDIFISGDHAYIADGDSGLFIVDITDPDNPETAGRCHTARNARSVFVSGEYAYVAKYALGALRVINISDPENPEITGTCNTRWRAFDVFVSGEYAYVAEGDSGLSVINISNPENPVMTGVYDGEGYFYDVFVSDDLAYVAGGSYGLCIIDVSNPGNLREIGRWDTPGAAHNVCVSGDYAYVAASTAGLRIIDVSNPENPEEVGVYDTPGNSYGVTVEGGYAYLADNYRFRVIDISDPMMPAVVEAYWTPGSASGVFLCVVQYVVGKDMEVFDYRMDDSFISLSPNSIDFGAVPLCRVRDKTLTIRNLGTDDLRINDILVQDIHYSVNFEGEIVLEPNARHELTVSFETGREGQFSGTLFIDSNDPRNNEREVSLTGSGIRGYHIDTPGSARDVCISGDYAYVADWTKGLRVIDVSDRENLVEVGFIDTTGNSQNVFISDTIAYLANGRDGVFLINISNPENPETVVRPLERMMFSYRDSMLTLYMDLT